MNSAHARWQASAALGLAVARRAYRFWGSALPTGATIMLERRSQLRAPTQRIGIVPDLEVSPTIAGIREGRDEVLEAGVSYVLGREFRLPDR